MFRLVSRSRCTRIVTTFARLGLHRFTGVTLVSRRSSTGMMTVSGVSDVGLSVEDVDRLYRLAVDNGDDYLLVAVGEIRRLHDLRAAEEAEEPCVCGHGRARHARELQECDVPGCDCEEWWKPVAF